MEMWKMVGLFGTPQPATFANTFNSQVTPAGTQQTFANANLGAADGGRIMLLLMTLTHTTAGTAIGTVTLGGVTMTLQASRNAGGASTTHSRIYSAPVPTGTTGDLVINHDSIAGGSRHIIVSLIRTTNLLSQSATATDAASSTTNQTITASVTSQDNGLIVGVSNILGTEASNLSNLATVYAPGTGPGVFRTYGNDFANGINRSVSVDIQLGDGSCVIAAFR